ncbi:hypothetical protein [Micrococcus luteus]|uniref:hypothetical protein n=1 Tax=Micrococcus luteus TaxID=1270 RepID=UPI001C2264C1|nr:hypothetical protein [Micrococcus luteus]MBU8793218.1 hypothetical protein [Micrococcus luteus]
MDWWSTVDWGSAPDWFGAVGTISAVGVALLQTHREGERHRQQEAKDAERIAKLEAREEERVAKLEARERRDRVRGIELSVTTPWPRWRTLGGGDGLEESVRTVRLRNGSRASISEVAVYGIEDNEPLHRWWAMGPGREEAVVIPSEAVADNNFINVEFYDEEGHRWVVDTDGAISEWDDMYVTLSPGEGQELRRADAPTPDRVTPQPSSPAPPASAPAEDPPQPGGPS